MGHSVPWSWSISLARWTGRPLLPGYSTCQESARYTIGRQRQNNWSCLPTGSGTWRSFPIATWPWEAYLGADALEAGVDVCVSTWNRPAPNTFPSHAKAAGHYNNAQLIKMEALTNGYAEGIVLGTHGRVSEGGGQNLFLIQDGVVVTPELDGTLLQGITRDAILILATDIGLETREKPIPREDLYTADELFFTGTATEVTPIRSVDRIEIGDGKAGPLSREIQKRFMAIVTGEAEDPHGWRTLV